MSKSRQDMVQRCYETTSLTHWSDRTPLVTSRSTYRVPSSVSWCTKR